MGQVIPQPGSVTLKAIVTRAIGQQVVWIKNGDVLSEADVPPTGELALETAASPGDWFTVVVRQRDDPTVFANAVFVAR